MQRRLIFSYLLLVAVTLALFTVPVTVNLTSLLRDNQVDIAFREARTVALLLGRTIGSDNNDPDRVEASTAVLAQLRTALEAETGGRVELVDSALRPALGRSVHDPGSPTLAAALRGEETVRTVESSVLGQPAVEITVPARSDSGVVDGAVRLSYPTAPVDAQIRSVWSFRISVALGTLAAAVALGVLLARSLTRPLRGLDAMARSLSAGDFSARVGGSGPRETHQLARTLNDGARQLGALVTAQQQFVADASHQLRTPLTALRLNLDNLYDAQTTDDGRRSAERAINEVQRMISLVNDLLILARAQAGTRRPEVLDLTEVVEQRVEMWEAAAGDIDVRLSVEIGSPFPGRLRSQPARPGPRQRAVQRAAGGATRLGHRAQRTRRPRGRQRVPLRGRPGSGDDGRPEAAGVRAVLARPSGRHRARPHHRPAVRGGQRRRGRAVRPAGWRARDPVAAAGERTRARAPVGRDTP